jgi:glucose-1-phosphate cytidylyltransferase
MIRIGDNPIIWHIMKHYAHYGHKDFVLALGYRGEMLKEYFYNYKVLTHDFTVHLGDKREVEVHDTDEIDDWTVTLVDTGRNALKGARIKQLEPFIGDDLFMLTYGDGVSDIDLNKLLEFHHSHGCMATVTGVVPSMRFGEVHSRTDGTVDFKEKRSGGPAMVNGGYYVLHRKIFDYLNDRDNCDFEIGPLEEIATQRQLMMYRHEGFWHCMDNIRDMDALNQMWDTGSPPWKIWD